MLRTKNPLHQISRHLSSQTLKEKLLNLLKQSVSSKTLQQIHAQMVINSVDKPNFLLVRLVDVKDFDYAHLVFSQLPEPNDYSFNVMIRGLTTAWKRYNLTLEFYHQMKISGLKPNNFTYPFVFMACGNLLALDHGRKAHSSVSRHGLMADGHVRHSLITMYSKCGQLGCARKVFDEILDRDLVSWNSMLSGYSKMGFAGDALDLFGRMRDEGIQPDEMTLVSVLVACGDLGNLSLGRWVEDYVVCNKMELNSYIGSSLIDMYGKSGDLLSARRVFDGMKKKDVVTWNAMITGYAQNGLSDEAILLFNIMKDEGVNADKITLSGVLSACASIGALDFGTLVDTYASQVGLQDDLYVATALVDMYAKCGSIDHASRVFEKMPLKNEVSWNAMISALASHGRAREAISLFERMSEYGGAARPNDVTFIGILSACVHAGMVDEGRQFFGLMSSSFGLVPKIEHYTCMVDLLSRAGLVYEAWDFVREMPGKPDEIALGALLGACQKLGNIDVSEQVMDLLLGIEPSNSINYVISSKIYAHLRRWDDSARMRLLMRQNGVSKIPGYSWIEIAAKVHEFHAGDSSHTNSEEIYQLLDLVYEEILIEGYTRRVNVLETSK